MIKLICKRVIYYSQDDETAFFEWLQRIKSIESFGGIGDELHLILPKRQISNSDLRDLIAIFKRYKIDMKQLAQFENSRNRVWFHGNKQAFWHKRVFGIE